METFGRAAAARTSRKIPALLETGTPGRLALARQRGLTLIEVAMVLGIMALLMAAAMSFATQASRAQKEKMAREKGVVVSTDVAAAQAPSITVTEPEEPIVQQEEARAEGRKDSMQAVAEELNKDMSSMGKLMMAGGVIMGFLLMITGLLKLKQAAESQGETVKYAEGVWRIAVAAGLVAMPAVAAAIASVEPGARLFEPTDGRAQYASVPSKTAKVASVDIGLHDLAQKLDSMQLAETCPGTDFASQSCGTVGDYLVRRDMDGTISVSLLTRTAGGRPTANEVLRVVGQEPYLSNEIAARDLDAVKKQLIRTFMAR